MENNGSYGMDYGRPRPVSPPPEAEVLGRLEGLLHHIIFDLTEALKLLQSASKPRGSEHSGSIEGAWGPPS